MKFEFGIYTDVTELAFEVNPAYQQNGYTKIYLCSDTHVFWLARLLSNTNAEYEHEDGVYLLERNNLPVSYKGEPLTISKARQLLKDDDLQNWDFEEYQDPADAISDLDGGFGLN